MNELDLLTIRLLQHPGAGPVILNSAKPPCFALLIPGARACAVGGPQDILHVADLLEAFEAGDADRAAGLMGAPPASTS